MNFCPQQRAVPSLLAQVYAVKTLLAPETTYYNGLVLPAVATALKFAAFERAEVVTKEPIVVLAAIYAAVPDV